VAPRPPVRTQVSAGGVAFRESGGGWDVALVLVGPAAKPRWQLPKGLVEPGETPEAAAIREVREEAGVETQLVAPLDKVEYWYAGTEPDGQRVRYHKFVHFFLLRYVTGNVEEHDREVREARWVPLGEAPGRLAFASERRVVERAAELLAAG
jgi:8-oxo-dGTP pyrophosphatase MutT (NUDIX family)